MSSSSEPPGREDLLVSARQSASAFRHKGSALREALVPREEGPGEITVAGLVDGVAGMHASEDAIVLATDLNATVTGCSRNAARLLGLQPEEALGSPINQLIHIPVDLAQVAQQLLKGSSDVWRGAARLATPEGEPVELRVSSMLWTSGGSPTMVTVGIPEQQGSPLATDAAFFRALVERSSEVPVVCDRDFVVRYAAPSLEHIFGYASTSVVGLSGWTFTHPDDVDVFRRRWETALASPRGHDGAEVRGRHADGSWRWVHIRITNMLDDPLVRGVVLNISDVTPRREANIARANSEQLHATILQTAREGIWAVSVDGMTLFANAKMATLMGVTHDELTSEPVWAFFDEANREIVRRRLSLRAQGLSDSYELDIMTRRGERRCLLVSGSPLFDVCGNHIGNLGMFTDITQRKQLEQELAHSALYDSLTSLPNRALLFDRLQRVQIESGRTGEDIAVLYCDIDRFTEINRARGHAIGDEVLAAVAKRLRSTVRESDTVSRFGADEFLVLCPGTDIARARTIATAVCSKLQEPFLIAGHRIYLSVSVGVAATPYTASDELLDGAMSARYRAQELGRARVEVHDAALQSTGDDRLRVLMDLQTALDDESLEMYYQPIVRLHGSAPVGVEALMRWSHAEFGAISPAKFIPIAEDGGLMPRLGRWSLNRVCADAARHSQSWGDGWHLAVNMSTRQLGDPHVVDIVRDALEQSGLRPTRLLLEVTETAVVSDSTQTVSTLRAIRDLGVRIAIDDFGTGYSSLSYLRRFPVDMIKVDRSFVAGMTSDSDDLAIVASLVSLAAAVRVEAVAEGVETEEQAEILRRLGCPLAQGFLWSPAVPANELAGTMAAIAWRTLNTSPTDAQAGERVMQKLRRPAEDEAIVARIIALHRAGASLTTIAAALNADDLTTARGLRWHRSSVARVIADRQLHARRPGKGR